MQLIVQPGGLGKRHDPSFCVFSQMYAIGLLSEGQHVFWGHDLGQLRESSIVGALTQNTLLSFDRRVSRGDEHQESIQLALWKWERPFFFLRVLGGHHEEHLGQRVPVSIDGDGTFGHGFEER